MDQAIKGFNTEEIEAWLEDRVGELHRPLVVSQFHGGHSNLTFSVSESPTETASPRRWVLRRPPLGQVLATAHDMSREYRIISALADSPVPVPSVVGLSVDDSVNGAPFYVMDFVDGKVIRSSEQAAELSMPARRRTGESLVRVLGDIHAVEVDKVGLGDLAKKQDYIARQLKRWYGQFVKTEEYVEGGLGLPQVHEAHDTLLSQIPVQQGASIVHGDYRLDNCMIDGDGNLVAVLDWEICTLGDPLADVGLLWVYWTDPGEVAVMPQASPTSLDGFPSRIELMEIYASNTGRDLTDLPFYIAFGYWKLTCIIAGVYARYAGGAMGEVPEEVVTGFRGMLDALSEATSVAISQIGSDWRTLTGATR